MYLCALYYMAYWGAQFFGQGNLMPGRVSPRTRIRDRLTEKGPTKRAQNRKKGPITQNSHKGEKPFLARALGVGNPIGRRKFSSTLHSSVPHSSSLPFGNCEKFRTNFAGTSGNKTLAELRGKGKGDENARKLLESLRGRRDGVEKSVR